MVRNMTIARTLNFPGPSAPLFSPDISTSRRRGRYDADIEAFVQLAAQEESEPEVLDFYDRACAVLSGRSHF